MTIRRYLVLSLLGLVSAVLVATFQKSPGYMDADYYFTGGLRMAQGFGLSEPFLWNYLDDPAGIPHPAFSYWMPLASFLVYLSMKLTGLHNFVTARFGFLVLIALLPSLTARLSYTLSPNKNTATLAGLLSAFSGFYLPFLVTTDTFGLYMVLGTLFLIVTGWKVVRLRLKDPGSILYLLPSILQLFCLGLIAGFMHLARADGILWLVLAVFVVAYLSKELRGDVAFRKLPGLSWVSVLVGYILVMGPWMARNLHTFGTLLAPGGARALWITSYDELFTYPASQLTPGHWLESGLAPIVQARLWSLCQNMQTTLAVQGSIFLAPLILLGLWRLRKNPLIQFGGIAWSLTFLTMTFVFPFAGARGGFFHSGAALQPFFWALAPLGLESFVEWGLRVRGWEVSRAWGFFSSGLVVLAILLSFMIVKTRIVGVDFRQSVWDKGAVLYARMEQNLQKVGALPGEIVLVNNPPGYFVASGRSAIYTPFGNEQTLLAVAHRYGARFLLLEFDHAHGLDEMYANPGDRPGLDYLFTVDQTQVYRIFSD